MPSTRSSKRSNSDMNNENLGTSDETQSPQGKSPSRRRPLIQDLRKRARLNPPAGDSPQAANQAAEPEIQADNRGNGQTLNGEKNKRKRKITFSDESNSFAGNDEHEPGEINQADAGAPDGYVWDDTTGDWIRQEPDSPWNIDVSDIINAIYPEKDGETYSEAQLAAKHIDPVTKIETTFGEWLDVSRMRVKVLMQQKGREKSYHRNEPQLTPQVVNTIVTTAFQARPMGRICHENLKTLRDDIIVAGATNVKVQVAPLIKEKDQNLLEVRLANFKHIDGRTCWLNLAVNRKAWIHWPADVLFKRALLAFPPDNQFFSDGLDQRIRDLGFTFTETHNFACVDVLFQNVTELLKLYESPEKAIPGVIKALINKIKDGGGAGHQVSLDLKVGGQPKDMDELWTRWDTVRQEISAAFAKYKLYSDRTKLSNNPAPNGPSRQERRELRRQDEKKREQDRRGGKAPSINKGSVNPNVNPGTSCKACGRSGHVESDCELKKGGHPDCNYTAQPWAESAMGKAWKEKGRDVVGFHKFLARSYDQYPLT